MKTRYLFLFAVLLMLASFDLSAQQDPQYTQYMYNMNVVNPAYAGSKENLSVGALYRNQWSGLNGSPQTLTFNAHTPLGEKFGVGLSGINDQIGPVDQTNVFADVSYTIEVGKESKLAFGIKAGATFQSIGFSDRFFQDDMDPAFQDDVDETYASVGAGLLYYTDKFYVGLSTPNFLRSTHLEVDNTEFGSQERHFFFTAGYVFNVNDNIKLKPSTFVKSEFGSAISFDVNTNVLFYDRFEVGASYRYEDAISGLASVRATDWMQVGFAYDATQSNLNEPSYEAFIILDIFFKKKTYVSPRYF